MKGLQNYVKVELKYTPFHVWEQLIMKQFKNGVIYYDENLPKHIMNGKECVYWEKTIGTEMIVEYCKIQYVLKFLNYNKRYLDIFVNNKKHHICINSFYCRGNIQFLLIDKLKSVQWKYNIGEIRKSKNNSLYEVLNREIRIKEKSGYCSYEKWYKHKCLTCGYDNLWHREDTPLGCSCCKGLIVVKGINDINTKYPFVKKYLYDVNDGYKYSAGKNTYIKTKCPVCDNIKNVAIPNLIHHKYSCDICSDGISYPEKFIMNFLNQLNVKYIYQFKKRHENWCDRYVYDFFILDRRIILEIHGGQHYFDTNYSKAEDVNNNDKHKEELARRYVDKYIIIDAKISNVDYIKKSIEQSYLSEVYDLSNIDWNECNISGLKKYVKEAIKLWNEGYSTKYISNQLNVSEATIKSYLKNMANNKIINYNSDETIDRRKNEDELIWLNEWMTEDLANFERMERKYIQYPD